MKNYLDVGQVVKERIKEKRLYQEVLFFDGTTYQGDMGIEEESNLAYKEGQGRLKRGNDSLCFYTQLKGGWSRGMLHGRRIEMTLNPNTFPRGYFFKCK
jgi:hypothetical protein